MICMASPLSRSLILTAAIAAVGCSSTSPVKYSGLDTTSRMTPNTADDNQQIPFRYSPSVDWSKYRNIVIDPVEIYAGSDAQFNDLPQEERRQLADYMQKRFAEELAEKFTVNTSPANGPSLRLKLTLTGADTTPQVVGTFTKFDLAGGPYNIVQSVRGGRGLMSGYVNLLPTVRK